MKSTNEILYYQQFALTAGWRMDYNMFYDVEPSEKLTPIGSKELLCWDVFKDSLLLLENEEKGVFIDLGWYPEANPEGQFCISLMNIEERNWQDPSFEFCSKSKLEIVKKLEQILFNISNGLELESPIKEKLYLQPFVVSYGWQVEYNIFYDVEPFEKLASLGNSNLLSWSLFKGTLLILKNERYGFMVNLGWHPQIDPEGFFSITLLEVVGDNNVRNPMIEFKSRSKAEIVSKLEEILQDVTLGKIKNQFRAQQL
jgi:hypothetical protein